MKRDTGTSEFSFTFVKTYNSALQNPSAVLFAGHLPLIVHSTPSFYWRSFCKCLFKLLNTKVFFVYMIRWLYVGGAVKLWLDLLVW